MLLSVAPAAAADGDAAECPRAEPQVVLAIGSSTLASVLGPMLVSALGKDGLSAHHYGVPSSGLARPDFHDWVVEGQRLIERHAPEVIVVELGTNDAQGIWEVDHWVRRSAPGWESLYAQRIDALLAMAGGAEHERFVIWVGPYAFAADNALEQGPIIHRLLGERIAAFQAAGGRALYVDAWGATTDRKGWPLKERTLPGWRGRQPIRTDDGIHLTGPAVKALLARPIVERVRACVAAAGASQPGEPTASGEAPSPKTDTP